MPWGYDDWLMNRAVRQDWMRSIALVGLAEQVLRTPAVAGEALACILDELLGDATPWTVSEIDERVARDRGRAGEWVRAALADARAQAGSSFESMALLLPDVAPYRLRLAFVNAPVHGGRQWDDSVAWRSSDDLATPVLDELRPLLSGLPEDVQAKADYVVPLAYAAFLLSDVLRAADAAEWAPVREAIVIYEGGDSIDVPMKRRS
jgi:hypothetical protein